MRLVKNFIDLFFPPVCVGCENGLLSHEYLICTLCRHEIPLTHHHLNQDNMAFRRLYGRIPVEYVSALFYFYKEGIAQKIIHQLKYHGQESIGTMIGQWYASELKSNKVIQTVDVIIPVPLHKKKLKERGYNQLTEFGKTLAQNLGVNFDSEILVRKIHLKSQARKKSNRIEGLDDVFDVCFDEKNHNTHFLLIDDVLTTGTTLEACSKALLKIPGAKISIVCMAMSNS